MSIKIMSAVWRTQAQSHTEKLVLLALADNANDEGVCWPSIPTIASKCDLTDRAVQDRIRLLEEKGWLSIRQRSGRASTYKLSIPTTPERRSPVNAVHPTPERGSPPLVNGVHPEPSSEPPKEPSIKQGAKYSGFVQPRGAGSSVIPEALASPEFLVAWAMWIDHLKQKRKPPTLHTQDLQLARLSKMGPRRAVEAIHHCIEHNWQGIYEPTKNNGGVDRPSADRNSGNSNARNLGQYDGVGKVV